MSAQTAEKKVTEYFAQAGVAVGGHNPRDIRVNDPRFFAKVFRLGALGLGEAFVEKWFECDAPDEMVFCALRGGKKRKARAAEFARAAAGFFFNPQSVSRAKKSAAAHYDMEPEVFRAFLDRRMIYSCAYWPRAKNLDEAQEHKMNLVAAKLRLQKKMQALDIGCGWGGCARYLAEKYGANITGITLSERQREFAENENAHPRVRFLLRDYRRCEGEYDAIYSVGMFEHVGKKNHREFFQTARRLLKPGGVFLLHTIGEAAHESVSPSWAQKYIFPGGELPSQRDVAAAMEGLFVIDDWHNFGADYDKTLMQWRRNFADNFAKMPAKRQTERFFRTWDFFLSSCAGAFRARRLQLWQLLLSPADSPHPQKIPQCR